MTVPSAAFRSDGPASTPSDRADAGWASLFAAWLVATISTLGALFLSEVMGVAPCVLCWYQRVFMFPLVIVRAAGLFPLDRKVVRYAAPLAAAGWLVALFHVMLTKGYIPESATPWQELYRSTVGQLDSGAVMEMAVKYRGVAKKTPRHNH